MKAYSLSSWSRPILVNVLVLLGIGSVWLASVLKKTSDDSRGRNSIRLSTLNLLIATPSMVALIVNISVFRSQRKLMKERDARALRKARHQANHPFMLPPIPTPIERVAERREEALQEAREGLDLCLRRLFGFVFAGIALVAIVQLRLFLGIHAFGGDASKFSFGWKFGREEDEENIAFKSWRTSSGYIAVGFFTAFLCFPAVVCPVVAGLETTSFRQCCFGPIATKVVLFAPSVLSMLPVYFLLDNSLRYPGTFAGSSYASQTCEWAYGFFMGVTLADLVTSITVRARVKKAMYITSVDDITPEAGEEEEEEIGSCWPWSSANKEQNSGIDAPCCNKLIERLAGILLFSSMVTASVLMATTWHNCLDDDEECLNSMDDTSVTVLFVLYLAIPATAVACAVAVKKRRG